MSENNLNIIENNFQMDQSLVPRGTITPRTKYAKSFAFPFPLRKITYSRKIAPATIKV